MFVFSLHQTKTHTAETLLQPGWLRSFLREQSVKRRPDGYLNMSAETKISSGCDLQYLMLPEKEGLSEYFRLRLSCKAKSSNTAPPLLTVECELLCVPLRPNQA